MPSSSVRTFTEPDEYAAAIRGSTIEISVTQRGLFKGDITRIDLDRLWLQRLSDNLSRTFHTLLRTRGVRYRFFHVQARLWHEMAPS
jgi:hypothetical protein